MKVQFQSRISGYYKVSYITKTVEVKSEYYLIPYGQEYLSCGTEKVINRSHNALWIDGNVYEIKPRSTIYEIE